MKIRTIKYMIKQGLKGLWRNRMMSIASISSVASALVILGIMFMIVLNINSLAETAKGQFDSIQVFLQEGLEEQQIQEIGIAMKMVEKIESVEYQPKEKALENMKKDWGDQGYLLEGLEKNPLPNSYIIQLKDIHHADSVVAQIKDLKGIEEIKYYKDIVDKLLQITKFVRLAGMAVIIILIGISIFTISNTIKLTVAARYREINIMKYVGATNWFIRWPFLIEGLVLGLVGSLIALGIVGYGYKQIYDVITQKLYVMLSVYMIPTTIIVDDLMILFVVIGGGIGALASIFSMKKFLKV